MKTQTGLLVTTAVGALMIGMGFGTEARAADQMVVKAAPAPVGWWNEGFVEVGGRFFINHSGGPTGGNWKNNPGPYQSLGKFYEYRDLHPGPFGNLYFATGSRDGLYLIDFWAKNIGYDDQSYYLNFSQAGVQYLTLGFDQTPHIYNNNASTIYQGVGSTTLTIPDGVRGTLATQFGPGGTAANPAGIANTVESNLNNFTLGFQRYTGTADYRWTPTDNWDVTVDYNLTRRDGTQPQNAMIYVGPEAPGLRQRGMVELPKPIQDETHTANVNAEYAGVTPWGKKFNVRAGYGLSAYRDDAEFYTFQHPFTLTDQATAAPFRALNNMMSMAPDNTAHIVRLNGAVELPWRSRYVAAVNYTTARQNAGFLPFAYDGNFVGTNPLQAGPPTISGSSNFGNNNLLINNVLTTSWTSELKQTSRYRYYDYDGSHDPVAVNYFLLADTGNVQKEPNEPFLSRGISYTKQNASSEFVWHPASVRWLTLGAGAGWEQWNRHQRNSGEFGEPDVGVTNEWMGKVFGTAKPWAWSQFRGSYIHAQRRYDGTYQENIGGNDSDTLPPPLAQGYRAYDMANRNRDKANLYWDFMAPNGFVITPTGGFRFDDYTHDDANGDPNGLGGLLHDNSWNAGLQVSWKWSPLATLFASYTREEAHREIMASVHGAGTALFQSNVDDTIHTFIVGANLVVVPDKLDVKVAYTFMHSDASITGGSVPQSAWPNTTNDFNRVDVQGRYKVDPSIMQSFGWKGETYVKMRYMWESNQATDFAAVNWNYLYGFNGDTGAGPSRSIFLGWNNPNYNVQLMALSVGFKW